MNLQAWWPLLGQESRDWLIAHNGDALSAAVLEDIARVGRAVPPDESWGVERRPDGVFLSDAGVDWIEAVANAETP